MRAILARLLCLLAAISLMEGHVVALQTYAWVTMLNDRIPTQGVSDALSTTFDGQHPCEHCLTVQDLQQESQQEDASLPSFEFGGVKLLKSSCQRISPPSRSQSALLPFLAIHELPSSSYFTSVPSPPPRASA